MVALLGARSWAEAVICGSSEPQATPMVSVDELHGSGGVQTGREGALRGSRAA